MLLFIAFVIFVLWLLGLLGHVAGGLINLLLIGVVVLVAIEIYNRAKRR